MRVSEEVRKETLFWRRREEECIGVDWMDGLVRTMMIHDDDDHEDGIICELLATMKLWRS